MSIYESAENYLEAILVIKERSGNVRSTPTPYEERRTVTDGFITLCPSGQKIAERIYERHTLLTRFFINIGVDKEVASQDACKLEHDLSDETFQKIKEFAFKHKMDR